MTTKYHIPEAIIGAGGLGLSAWFLPIAVSINNTISSEWFRSTVNVQSMEFYTLLLCSVLCIFACIGFLFVGFYFSWIVCEDLVIFLWRRRNEREQT
jgi:hypothetical protein